MSIFGRTSLIIIAISTPALAFGNAGLYYRPSYHPPHNPYRQNNPPDRSNILGGTRLHVFDYNRPLKDTPNQAPPNYAQPVYNPPAVYDPPMYETPSLHVPPVYEPPAVYAPPAYAPPVYAAPVVYKQPPYDLPTTTSPPTIHPPPVTTDKPYNPPAAYTSAYNSPAHSSTSTQPSHTPVVYAPKPTPEDTPENAQKDAPKDAPEGAHRDASEDTPHDTPQPKYAYKDAHEDTPEDAHKDASEDTPHDTPQLEDANKDAYKDTPEDKHDDVPEVNHNDVPEVTPEDTYEEPTPPSRSHGKPSPLPNSVDRRNAPRVSRKKISRSARRALPRQGHTRRFPFLKKRQQPGQHPVAPVTVNMIPGAGHATSTSGALATTTANALPASPPPLAPGIKIDTSQDALSVYSNPESTMPSIGAPNQPGSSHLEGSRNANLGPAVHPDKFTAIASVLSIVIGLIVFTTIVKLTSNAMRKRKHPAGLGKYEDHLSSKGLIPEMGDKGHFETHDVIITRPDGSEISPLSSSRSSSPSPRPLGPRIVNPGPPPLPMPTFAPPPVPTSPLAMPYVKLLSPTANLVQQNLVQDRTSEASEIMSMSTTTTDISERPSASDGEVVGGRQLSHRRMRSAPGSVVWSARSSAATGKFTSEVSGSEGYWESIDVCGSESASRMTSRLSRGKSVAMSVMW